MAATELLEIRPQPGPQTAFLSTPADIAVYGGSAGGGKSWALLVEPLRHIENPRFGAVIFRRTSPQITNEGALWDASGLIYPLAGATPSVGSLDWRFRSGANVGMRHLQHEANKYDWQGSEVALLEFDELPHFSEGQFWYLTSRNRSTCGVRPYVRASCNPDPYWVKRFLAPWVDREFPHRAKSGEIRWFLRVDGQIKWVAPGTEDAKSLTFVRASVYDNRILLKSNPEYLSTLKALPEIDRRRLLEGDWDVRREGLVYPDFDSCIVDDEWPEKLEGKRCGGMDFGYNNPFAAPAGTLDHDDVLWIDFLRYRSHCTLPIHSEALPRGGTEWFADPARPDEIAELRIAGHDVKPCLHMGARPLLSGIDRVSERIRTGRLKIRRSTCGDLIRESGLYCYDPMKHREEPVDADNHSLDALRYLVVGLDRGRAVEGMPPQISEEEQQRLDEVAEAARLKYHDDVHMDPENPHWWPEMDDD